MDGASTSAAHAFRPQLLERRARLQATARSVSELYFNQLLDEIDSALARIDSGTFGLCETCHDTIEADRLEQNPLTRFCLDHLSPAELRAHEQDLDLAVQIQSKLLPRSGLAVAGWETQFRYQPARGVGGDYCELMALDDGKSLFFAVGDVAGKGVAASLLMTHLSAIFRSLLSLDLRLGDVVARANRLFCESTAPAHYATLVCGRATADEVEICNAGHCPPLLLRRDAVLRLDSTGLPLGLFCGAEYAVERLRMAPREILALYSDGISEAQNPAGEEYEERRLIDALRGRAAEGLDAITAGVLADVTRFRQTRPPQDDMTLLVVQRRA